MAVRYIPYFPNTLEGQALLDNFVRTKRVLRYKDNDKVIERIERGMPLYEVELTEKIGDNSNENMLEILVLLVVVADLYVVPKLGISARRGKL